MSAAQILKSMKSAPVLEKSTYNRWSTHLLDALSLFDVDDYILTEKTELANRNIKPIPENIVSICKKDKNIRVAISQLVPDVVFHLVDPSYTSKQCWDNLQQYYRPNSTEDIDDLLQEFWNFTVEEEIDVDDFVQKLSEIKAKIALIDRNSAPSESSMKKRIVGHFIKCCGGFYMSTVISLRDMNISFQSTIASIRASQEVYRELHQAPVVALIQEPKNNPSTAKKVKSCAYCKRRGHLRESCFLWIDTPDGSKWAAKNPEKLAKVRKLQKKSFSQKGKGKATQTTSTEAENSNKTSLAGAWMMEEHALVTYISR